MKKLTFKQRMMLERESLIIETVNHLLATKGYDAMTVDDQVVPFGSNAAGVDAVGGVVLEEVGIHLRVDQEIGRAHV